MKNRNLICRLVFFAVMLVLVFSVAVCAAAETTDPCPEGAQHKGPFSYRNRINATCTEQGQQDKYCDACGRFVGTEPIGAIGHLFEKSPKVIKAPDCYNDGLEQQTEICKVCGYNKGSVDVVLPKLGHDWGPWRVTTAPTCTTAGVETRICKRDSSHVETNPLAAIGHDWGPYVTTKEPTCTEPGVSTSTCKNDPSHTQTKPIDPIGHNWGPYVTTKEPTCTEPGVSTSTCKNDPSHTQTKPIDPIGHDWDSGKVTKEPDCTNPGVRTYTCKNDPTHTKTEPIPIVPDAHKWDNGKVTKQPDCTNPGVRTYTCTINSAHTKTEPIPIAPDAHDWGPGVVTKAPTCEEPGVLTITCRINAAHTKTEPIAPIGHKWDKGVVTKQPTMTEPGEKLYTCQNDPSHTYTEKLDPLTRPNNTLCAFGPRLRDYYRDPSRPWYMFTPFDASKDGVQTYELVASNNYIVGSCTLTIKDGNLRLDYKLVDTSKFTVTLEFFTVLHRIDDLTKYEPEDLLYMKWNKNQDYNLAEYFGEDTNLVLYFCSRCTYSYSNRYLGLNYNSTAHQRLLRSMEELMKADLIN